VKIRSEAEKPGEIASKTACTVSIKRTLVQLSFHSYERKNAVLRHLPYPAVRPDTFVLAVREIGENVFRSCQTKVGATPSQCDEVDRYTSALRPEDDVEIIHASSRKVVRCSA